MNAKQRIARIMDAGCRVCKRMGVNTPAQEFHHIHGPDKRRIGPDVGIGLCHAHHRGGQNNSVTVSRHPWKKVWESRYGTEKDMYHELIRELGWHDQ